MNRLILIPGKNPNLSLAELASWCDSRGLYFRLAEMGDGFMAAEAEKTPDANHLGGMIKVCSLLESFDRKPELHPGSIFDSIPAKDLPKQNLFGLSVYPDSRKNNTLFNHFATSLKKSLRDSGINSKFFPVPQDRSSLTHVEVVNKKLEEIVVCLGKKKIHIARTVSVHNPFEFQKRDIKRPQQRPMYSIPPRLARIMINLAKTPDSKTLLDPFCGIGSILQEAALMDFEIFGSDMDGRCCLQAIQNLKWLSREYKLGIRVEKRIIMADATRLSEKFQPKSIDIVVTEPHLGPPLKIHPDRNKAQRILRGLKPLYEKSLQEIAAVLTPGGRLSIVFPRFEFGKHFAHLEALKMAEKAGLKPVDIFRKTGLQGEFPYIDKEERHKTIREIWVFEKPAVLKIMPKPPLDAVLDEGLKD